MGRRMHTTLVYFGLVDDEELADRLREREPRKVWIGLAGGAFLMLGVVALWALAKLVGVDSDLADLAIAEGMLLLLIVIAHRLPDDAPAPPRPLWREWLDHQGAIVALWSCFALVAALLGHRPTDRTVTTVAAWCVGVAVLDGARLAWRARRRPTAV
jgi:branched-subunit amino acid ABC-type transport system permease component